jgi:uncharacterized protein YkwD
MQTDHSVSNRTFRTRGLGLAAALAAAVAAILPAPAPAAAASSAPVAGFASTPAGGWYVVRGDGTVEAGGGARRYGDMSGARLNRPVTGIAATPTGRGYWLVASDGGIFSFGDARFFGSTGALRLNRPIVGMAPTASGRGYWLVASDGGIFSFGDARFFGSTGALQLKASIVGMAATPKARGYWLVASDGGIFSFGDARFHGSTGAMATPAPIVAMAGTVDAGGYWLAAGDGRVYRFGNARYYGAPFGKTFGAVVGIVRRADVDGYVVVEAGGYHRYGPDGTRAVGSQPAPSGTPESRILLDLVARANDERRARGLQPLQFSEALSADAASLASRMAANGVLKHLVDFSTLMPKYGATGAGENIAYTGYSDVSASAHTMWMQSDGHRANLLNSGFDRIGIGVVCKNGTAWISQLFLRVGSVPFNWSTPPLNPITRTDSDPNAGRRCA